MKFNAITARKYTRIGSASNINKGDLVMQKTLAAGMRGRKKLKKLGPISVLTLAQRSKASARDIKKLKKAMLNSSYGLHIAGSISYDTKYLYDEGGNIMNHMNLGNKKTLTRGQERDRYDQGGI
jgi:hypothetical protein